MFSVHSSSLCVTHGTHTRTENSPRRVQIKSSIATAFVRPINLTVVDIGHCRQVVQHRVLQFCNDSYEQKKVTDVRISLRARGHVFVQLPRKCVCTFKITILHFFLQFLLLFVLLRSVFVFSNLTKERERENENRREIGFNYRCRV